MSLSQESVSGRMSFTTEGMVLYFEVGEPGFFLDTTTELCKP